MIVNGYFHTKLRSASQMNNFNIQNKGVFFFAMIFLFSFIPIFSFGQQKAITSAQKDTLTILLLDKFYGKDVDEATDEEMERINNVIIHVNSEDAYRSMMDLYGLKDNTTKTSKKKKRVTPNIRDEEIDYPAEDISSNDLADRIILSADVSYDSVSLKWMPRNPDILRDGIVYGYGIQRVEVNEDGYMVLATSEVLSVNGPKFPWNEEQIMNLKGAFEKNDVDIDSSFFQFMKTGNYAKIKNPNEIYAQILKVTDDDQLRVTLGLSFVDKSIDDNQKYAYSIFIQRNKDILHTGTKEVEVPEKPRPKPPRPAKINMIETQDEAVVLHVDWSSSSKVAKHQIQRKPSNQEEWKTILEFDNELDSLVYDKKAEFDTKLDYRILAIGENGLVSPASNTKTVTRSFNPTLLNVPDIDILEMKSENTVIVSWSFEPPDIDVLKNIPFTFTILKSDNKGKLGVYDRVASDIRNWADEIVRSRGKITYAIQVVFKNGIRGPISEKVVFTP